MSIQEIINKYLSVDVTPVPAVSHLTTLTSSNSSPLFTIAFITFPCHHGSIQYSLPLTPFAWHAIPQLLFGFYIVLLYSKITWPCYTFSTTTFAMATTSSSSSSLSLVSSSLSDSTACWRMAEIFCSKSIFR